ncbi:MAG: CopG family transcriptional regulator [Moorea sp. SIO3G5]|nr:CopG family transcriptional regulator [Moorena sp. SIO3G5]
MAKTLTIDISDDEQAIIERYCQRSKRSQTDVIRDLIITVVKNRLKRL